MSKDTARLKVSAYVDEKYLAAGTWAWFVETCGQGVSGSAAPSCDSDLACCYCLQGWRTTGSTEAKKRKQETQIPISHPRGLLAAQRVFMWWSDQFRPKTKPTPFVLTRLVELTTRAVGIQCAFGLLKQINRFRKWKEIIEAVKPCDCVSFQHINVFFLEPSNQTTWQNQCATSWR